MPDSTEIHGDLDTIGPQLLSNSLSIHQFLYIGKDKLLSETRMLN